MKFDLTLTCTHNFIWQHTLRKRQVISSTHFFTQQNPVERSVAAVYGTDQLLPCR